MERDKSTEHDSRTLSQFEGRKYAVGSPRRVRAELHSLFAIVAYYADALVLKAPTSVVAFAVRPLSFLFLIIVISSGGLFTSGVVGAVVSFLVGVGLADLPIELAGMKRRSQFYELFRSLPMSKLTMAVGIAVGQSLPGFLYGVFLLGVVIVSHGLGVVPIIAVLLIGTLIWTWGILTGHVIGVWLEKPILVQRVTGVAVVISTTLAPAYYPVELLPDFVEPVALLIPTASGAYLLRNALGAVPFRPLAAAVLPTAVALSAILALRINRD